MIINKFKHFVQLGLACAAISLSMGAMGADNHSLKDSYLNINMDNYSYLAQDIAKDNTPINSNFSLEKFYKKYHLDGSNIKVNVVYLEDGMPFNGEANAMPDLKNPGKSNILIVLDKNGNLYNIDKIFKGENKLNQAEKDLLRDQALLHEYAHTHFFEDNRLESNKLNKQDAKIFQEVFLNKYNPNSISQVYEETAAQVASYLLIINHNQDNLDTLKSLLTKNDNLLRSNEKKDLSYGHYDSHMMTTQGTDEILKNFDGYKNMSLNDIWNYTVPLVSDITVKYAAQYHDDHHIVKNVQDYIKNQNALNDMIYDIVKGHNLNAQNSNGILYSEAKKIVLLYPELKTEKDLKKEQHLKVSIREETLFLATNIDYKPADSNTNFNMKTQERTDQFASDLDTSISTIRYGASAKLAEEILITLNKQYVTSPSQFNQLPTYNITQSLNLNTNNEPHKILILNKSSIMSNIKKLKEQPLVVKNHNTPNF